MRTFLPQPNMPALAAAMIVQLHSDLPD